MFHLYRIYDLQPVVHENLRPEKPQAVLNGVAEDDEEVGQGADAEGADAKVGTKRTRRTKKAKLEEETAETKDEELVGADETPKKRRRRTTKVKVEIPDTKAAEVSHTVAQGQDLASLMNQEDALEPVDGAPLDVVEAEEHPEAVSAAANDADARGVVSKGKGDRKRASRKRKTE